MNLSEVAQYIKNPIGFEKEQLADLKSLVEKYPYAQSFSIIYLKALSDLHSFQFEDELKKHACAITNRTLLFNLINNKPNTLEVASPQEKTIIAQEDEKPIIEALPTQDDGLSIAFDLPNSEKINEATENHNDQVEKSVIENENKAEEKETQHHEVTFDSPLDLEILNNVITSATPISEGSQTKSEEIEEMPKAVPHLVNEPAAPPQKKDFIDWLHASTNKPEERKEEHIKKEKINALIEDFITQSPKISSPKTDFYSANKKAVESVQEEIIPVSPTLAKIYALQGHYPKSIAIYQQLILKYPEKKTFFASQIKELEKKLNN